MHKNNVINLFFFMIPIDRKHFTISPFVETIKADYKIPEWLEFFVIFWGAN